MIGPIGDSISNDKISRLGKYDMPIRYISIALNALGESGVACLLCNQPPATVLFQASALTRTFGDSTALDRT